MTQKTSKAKPRPSTLSNTGLTHRVDPDTHTQGVSPWRTGWTQGWHRVDPVSNTGFDRVDGLGFALTSFASHCYFLRHRVFCFWIAGTAKSCFIIFFDWRWIKINPKRLRIKMYSFLKAFLVLIKLISCSPTLQNDFKTSSVFQKLNHFLVLRRSSRSFQNFKNKLRFINSHYIPLVSGELDCKSK